MGLDDGGGVCKRRHGQLSPPFLRLQVSSTCASITLTRPRPLSLTPQAGPAEDAFFISSTGRGARKGRPPKNASASSAGFFGDDDDYGAGGGVGAAVAGDRDFDIDGLGQGAGEEDYRESWGLGGYRDE